MSRTASISAATLRLVATSLAYLIASGTAVGLTRFGGGAAFLWGANAVLLAALSSAPRAQWTRLAASCWLGGLVVSGVWGLGWAAAPVMSSINVAEPLIGALLIRRWGVHRSGLESARDLTMFVLALGIVGPAATGFLGAATISFVSHTDYFDNYEHWLIGHALGALAFTPVFMQVASGELAQWARRATLRRKGEATLLLALVTIVAIGVFAQSQLPLLFLPMLPLMLLTFRVGRIGAALGVVVITIAGTILTLDGLGPINLIHAQLGERLQFLQFYLAATVMVVLPVAADLAHRKKLFQRLRDSEARFRLLTENSTDIVLSLDVRGVIRYASPSIGLLGGYDAHRIVGTSSGDLIDPEDHDRVRAVHREALAHPDRTFTVEYRGIVKGGDRRWFETHTRAVTDEAGVVQGVVSAIRDTSERRRTEAALSLAAHTDPLTGLSNRRAFDHALAAQVGKPDAVARSCVALFDLDHFKRINDVFGHAVGDDVLRRFARTAEAQTRGGDMLARIGGEEFGLLLPGLSVDQAHIACERIRASIEAASAQGGGWPTPLTVSIGIAAIARDDTAASVTRRADEALYAAKHQGRNRASLAA